VDLHLEDSERPGLKAFANGFVKDGAGAGGVSILAILKRRGSLTGISILRSIEEEYDKLIQK
jgi:NaMN:DMB phosphoribosyltransferase